MEEMRIVIGEEDDDNDDDIDDVMDDMMDNNDRQLIDRALEQASIYTYTRQ